MILVARFASLLWRGPTAATASEDPEIVRSTLARVFAEIRGVLTAHGGRSRSSSATPGWSVFIS